MKAAPIYASFSRGEVSPLMFGRVDIEQYYASLAKARNGIVRPYGYFARRSGTKFISETKDSSKEARLLKFVFSNSDSYIIELGAGYFRFYTNGGQVLKTLADTADWVTSTAYVKGNYVESGGAIYYCLVGHTSGTFATDLAANKWVLQDIYEVPNSYTQDQIQGLQFTQLNDIVYLTVEKTATSTYHDPSQLTRTSANNWSFADIDFKGGPYLDTNATATTIAASATTGSITLTASASIFQSTHVGAYFKIGTTVGTPAFQGYVKITSVASGTSAGATVMSTLSATTATTNWAEGAWSDYRGYPSCCVLHSGRLYLANSPYEPQKIWGSKTFSYNFFTPPVSNESDAAVNIQISAGDSNAVRWLASASVLLVGTFGGEFVISGGTEGITPTNAQATKRASWGSERLQPEKIGMFVYYIQRNARKIREFYYFSDYDTYKSIDMTLLSEHLTETGIKDTAYQQNPDSILWCVRNDGKLVGFTRELDNNVQGFTLSETDGIFENVEVIPSPTEDYDELWMIVKRTINGTTKRYIEYIDSPITCEIQDKCFYMDCGLNYDGYSATLTKNLTLSAQTGSVTATSSSAIFSAGMVGKRIKAIDSDFNSLGILKITGYTSTTVVTGTVIQDFDSTTYDGGEWGISVNTLSGLGHIESKTVDILADGAVQTPKVVASGAITLERDAFYVNVGLNYVSILETLPIEAGSSNGTAVGKRKRIYQLAIRMYKTLGISVGSALDKLVSVQFRNPSTLMGTPESLYTGLINNIKYNQGWSWDSNIILVQNKPLPMNILAIAPQVQENDT